MAALAGFAFLPAASALPDATSAPVVVKPKLPPETWQLVVAFPRLSFQDPLMIIPVPRSNQLCVITREGKVEFFANLHTVSTKTLVLNLSSQCQAWNDCGLLGIAFHPDFGKAGSPNRGYFYVWYNYNAHPVPGPGTVSETIVTSDRLERFTIPDGKTTADLKSGQVLIDQTDLSLWHNGGGMFFGKDGFLYLTLGDEGGSNDSYGNAQLVNQSLFSGVIRIDVNQNPNLSHPIPRQPVDGVTGNYAIPNDNPWVGQPNTLEEFYAIGLRSPHRLTYDSTTNTIFCGEVGQAQMESVDLIVKGGNYRWAYMEGNITGPVAKPATIVGTEKVPLFNYPHDAAGNDCVIGGYVYRGTLVPKYDGQYIFGDNTSGRIWAMTGWLTGKPKIAQITALPGGSSDYTGLSSFGYDAKGNLYVCKMGVSNGMIYRLVPNTP
jgi:glucose/arabinose dehydrogenase